MLLDTNGWRFAGASAGRRITLARGGALIARMPREARAAEVTL